MLFRLGSALILIGLIALVVFALTLSVGEADPRVLFAGAGLAVVGLLIHRRARPDRPPSSRFRTLRRVIGEPSSDDDPAD
jgi:hypothetical protein